MEQKVLTIRVNIEDPKMAEWIFVSMANSEPLNGVEVRAAAWGDVFAERDHWKKKYEELTGGDQKKARY